MADRKKTASSDFSAGGFFKKIIYSISKFSLRRCLYNRLLKQAELEHDSRRVERYKAKLEKLEQVRSNVMVKYIAKELFLYFLVCFLFFFVIFFVNQILLLAETILKKRVPVGTVVRLIWYCLPAIVAQSAPFATLVGFLMCLGRMVTDNEILILRASGQRYTIILIPVLIMGMAISVFSFVMNDYFLPLGTLNYNRMYRQILHSNPAVELESQSIKRMNNQTIVIGDVEKTHVSDLVFFDFSGDNEQRIIVAGSSDVAKSPDPGVVMEMNMDDSTVLLLNSKKKEDYSVIESDSIKLNVFESTILGVNPATSPREMTSFDLHKRLLEMRAGKVASKKQLNTYELEFNKKFSIPFGSIFFAMLAFPLALVFGRKDGQTLGLIFGLVISVAYWAATILGQMFGLRSGYNGFWMMWSPNFLIGVLGILLYFRLKRK